MKQQDVSYWSDRFKKDPQKTIADAKQEMENFHIDIDDDIYWFTYSGLANTTSNKELRLHDDTTNYTVRLWEIYRIHRSMNLTDIPHANFTWAAQKLVTVEGEKWQRRRDLKVSLHLGAMNKFW